MRRRLTLAEYDGDPDSYYPGEGNGRPGADRDDPRRDANARRRREVPIASTGSMHYCWCGEPMGHDWPGRDEGLPHPR